jgi:hypothetical protein
MWTNQIMTSLEQFAESVHNNRITILTESDFKSGLVTKIKENVNENITVNTETPWYDVYITKKTYYVDVTLFDRDKLKITYDPTTNRKGYRYDDEAGSIELKYFRYNSDIEVIAGDFKKMSLLIKMPKNDCFIIALARTTELFIAGEKFMKKQLSDYNLEYDGKVRVFLIGPESLTEII